MCSNRVDASIPRIDCSTHVGLLTYRKLKQERRPAEKAKWQHCIDELCCELRHVQNYDDEKRDFRRGLAPVASTSYTNQEPYGQPFAHQPFGSKPASPQTDANSNFSNGLRGDNHRDNNRGERRSRTGHAPVSNVWSKPGARSPKPARENSGIPPKPPVPKQPPPAKGGKGQKGVPGYDAGGDDDLVSRLLGEVLDDSPGVKWEDIAGLQDAKLILRVRLH